MTSLSINCNMPPLKYFRETLCQHCDVSTPHPILIQHCTYNSSVGLSMYTADMADISIKWRYLIKYNINMHGLKKQQQNQTVNDGVAHSKNPRKWAYHVTFDLDLEHTVDTGLPGDDHVQVWSRSSHLPGRRSDFRASTKVPESRDLRPWPWAHLDARWPGVHRVQVCWRSGHLSARRSDLLKS